MARFLICEQAQLAGYPAAPLGEACFDKYCTHCKDSR